MTMKPNPDRVFRGTYKLKDGTCKKSCYKLKIRVEVGEKYSPAVINLGLGTKSRVEAIKRAKLVLQYVQKINAYRKPALRVAKICLQRPD